MQFATAHQALLQIVIGKSGLLTNFVGGYPVAVTPKSGTDC